MAERKTVKKGTTKSVLLIPARAAIAFWQLKAPFLPDDSPNGEPHPTTDERNTE
jgi:hypothetical protein